MSARALIIDDDGNIRRMLAALLAQQGFEVEDLPGGATAVETAKKFDPEVVFLDLVMDGPDGLTVLEELRTALPHLVVVMMSGQASFSDAVRATKLGAIQFLEKPLTPDGILLAANAAVELAQTQRENRMLRQATGGAHDMVGSSKAIEEVRDAIRQVASSDSRVLITGESGTGKELVARAIHNVSKRSDQPFVGLNCAAIPRELIESELFGHERGSFTGATTRRHGKFEIAHRGTLFLDEVGDLQAEAQAKLLRALETGTVERVGGERPITTDVRIVAATNRDLGTAIGNQEFRSDLFYRLNVFPINVPPLRKRSNDVPELVHHFAALAARKVGKATLEVTDPAVARLQAHAWPGNIRELINLMERLAITSPEGITEEAVAHALGSQIPHTNPAATGGLTSALEDFERELIESALKEAKGNVADAARRLETDRGNLYRRMKRLGVRQEDT
jgi:two-component system nitrogen regulation response regulator NtrX